MADVRPIYSIGHSTLLLDDFITILCQYGIELLADIRTVPRSRTNPQYNLDSLPAALTAHGISYRHFPRLGGLRARRKDLPGESPNTAWRNTSFRNYADYALTPEFGEGLDELIAEAAAHTTAIMCAEAVWWRCHRRIVCDYLVLRGVTVLDIIPPAPPTAHELTPFARPQADGSIYYGRG